MSWKILIDVYIMRIIFVFHLLFHISFDFLGSNLPVGILNQTFYVMFTAIYWVHTFF